MLQALRVMLQAPDFKLNVLQKPEKNATSSNCDATSTTFNSISNAYIATSIRSNAYATSSGNYAENIFDKCFFSFFCEHV